MLLFLALCYAFLIWIIYFKFELLPYNKKNKIISTTIGVLLLAGIFLTLLAVAPYSKNLLIEAKVNPIAPRVSGKVHTIFIKTGELVKKGDPLFQLNTRGFDIRVAKAKGNLDTAKASYEKANKLRGIALALEQADPESISELQLINTEETLNELKGKYEAAKSELDQALNDLSKTTVYAPTDGFTPYLAFDDETTVSAYNPIMTFVSFSNTYPATTYTQNALAFVQEGDTVEFLLDIYPGHIFTGEVERIIWAAGEAQIFQGHKIPEVDSISAPSNYAVRFKVKEDEENFPLHFASKGQVVIYTQYWKPIQIIQKIHLRMQAWLKYIAIP